MAYMDNTIIGKLPVINKTRNSKMVKIESEKGKEFSMPYKKKIRRLQDQLKLFSAHRTAKGFCRVSWFCSWSN